MKVERMRRRDSYLSEMHHFLMIIQRQHSDKMSFLFQVTDEISVLIVITVDQEIISHFYFDYKTLYCYAL